MDAQGIAAKVMNAPDELRIAFRVDASVEIGTGHVMRCLTLADALRQRGASCTFISRPHSGNLIDVIAQRGHHTAALPRLPKSGGLLSAKPAQASWLGTDWQADAQDTRDALGAERFDWLVVDHYALDQRWEKGLRPYCQRLMVMDDLADRPHDCDLLLDQNLGRCAQDYCDLLNPHAVTFIGPQYALLRPEFAQLRSQSLTRRMQPQLKRLLITMGGVDKDNATGQVLQALSRSNLPSELSITVVMGPNAPCLMGVKEQAAQLQLPTQVLVGVDDMARLMTDSDLCIGAAGGTSWERCCLGLPTLLLVLADNQIDGASALGKAHAAHVLTSARELPQTFGKLLSDVALTNLKKMSEAAGNVSDGMGAQKIAASMFSGGLHA